MWISSPADDAVKQLKKKMEKERFVVDDTLAVTIYLALEMKRPLLIEGRVGVGKTDIAYVLARSLGKNVIRLQCYEGLDKYDAIYEWDYLRQIQRIRLESVSDNPSKDELKAKIFSDEYLLKRPLLQALYDGEQTVLLIDEVDKADEEFEAFLLEFLSDFQISIPEIGTITAEDRPIVILTSNRSREVGDALKRRCIYTYIEFPDYEKELKILQMKVPEAKDVLLRQICHFAQLIREMKFIRMPGPAEILDWTRALVIIGAENLNLLNIKKTAGCLFKDKRDLEELERNLKMLLARIYDEGSKVYVESTPIPDKHKTKKQDKPEDKTRDEDKCKDVEAQMIDINQEEFKNIKLPKIQKQIYSPAETDAKVKFDFPETEIHNISKVVNKFKRKVITKEGRRFQTQTKNGKLDLRQIMRSLVRGGGDIAEYPMKKHKILKTKLIVLCDVSGSMKLYDKFMLQFLYTLQNAIKNTETFLFSTHLTRITDLLKYREYEYAIETILNFARDYGGGTRIGQSLYSFNTYYGQFVNKKTVVIIISDGWDTGDIDLLSEEMTRLKSMAKRLIWLNPLLSMPSYRPICRGMSACLPFIDIFSSADSVASFEELIRQLDPAIFTTSRILDEPITIRPPEINSRQPFM